MLLQKFSTLVLSLVLVAGSFAADKKDSVLLNMANLRSTMTAYANTIELVVQDRSLIAKLKAEEAKAKEEGGSGANSFTSATKHLASTDPRFQAAFVKAGITPEQAGSVMESLFAIVLADGMLTDKSQKVDLPPNAAANLTFYRGHKAEITAMIQEFQAVSQKANKALGEQEE